MKRNSGIIGGTKATNRIQTSGVYELYDCYNSRVDNSWPRTKYLLSISPNVANHYEGETKTYTISLDGYDLGDSIYYTYQSTGGTVNSTDFVSDFSGSLLVDSNGNASLQPQLARDADSEGSDTFKIQIRDGSTSGTVLGESGTITIPNATYTLTPSTSTPNEGTAVTMTLAGTNTYTGTHYYSLEGTAANTSDIVSNLTGSFSFDGSSGTFTLSIRDDFTTEGSETLTVRARVNSTTGPIVASSTLTIQDSSITPTATITPSTTSLNEGSSVTFTVNTTNMTSGTLTYRVSLGADTEASDLASTYGTVSISSSTGSFAITATSDSITDSGTETFTAKIYNEPDGDGSLLATSSAVTINDTSTGTTEPTVEIYEKTYIAFCGYTKEASTYKTTYMVTNNEFVGITVYDDQTWTNGSGTTAPFIAKDYIYHRGYSGPGHRFKISDLSHQTFTSGNYAYSVKSMAGISSTAYASYIAAQNWSGGLYYNASANTTNLNNTFAMTNSTLVNGVPGTNNVGISTNGNGYMHGTVGLGSAIYLAKGYSGSGISASRMFKSTDGGVNFTETAQLTYSFGGCLGSYPDYDGGKLLWWFGNKLRTSSDGITWSTEVSESGNGIGSPSYRDIRTPVYNKDTQKFYHTNNSVYSSGSSSVYESTNGYTWTSSGTPQYSGTTKSLFNVVVMPNGDMVGMHNNGRFMEFYRFPRNGTSITWNTTNLVNKVPIAGIGSFITRYYTNGVFGPFGAFNGG